MSNKQNKSGTIIGFFKAKPAILLLIIIGAASVAIRLLTQTKMHESALLYVAIPYAIALILIAFTSPPKGQSLGASYLAVLRMSMIVFLSTSALLFEGFICVLMFIPIYLIVITLAYLFIALFQRAKSRRNKVYSSILPTLLLLSSVEGVVPELSFPTRYEVTSSQVVELSPQQIHSKLQAPIALQQSSHWLLAMFPMPYRIEAESLNPGDRHRVHYRYNKWLITNTHEGFAEMQVEQADEHDIRMKVLSDSSYIANYLRLEGTHIALRPIDSQRTQVRVSISFERKLSPAWYFGPLERYAVEQVAAMLIDEVIAND